MECGCYTRDAGMWQNIGYCDEYEESHLVTQIDYMCGRITTVLKFPLDGPGVAVGVIDSSYNVEGWEYERGILVGIEIGDERYCLEYDYAYSTEGKMCFEMLGHDMKERYTIDELNAAELIFEYDMENGETRECSHAFPLYLALYDGVFNNNSLELKGDPINGYSFEEVVIPW